MRVWRQHNPHSTGAANKLPGHKGSGVAIPWATKMSVDRVDSPCRPVSSWYTDSVITLSTEGLVGTILCCECLWLHCTIAFIMVQGNAVRHVLDKSCCCWATYEELVVDQGLLLLWRVGLYGRWHRYRHGMALPKQFCLVITLLWFITIKTFATSTRAVVRTTEKQIATVFCCTVRTKTIEKLARSSCRRGAAQKRIPSSSKTACQSI